MQREIEAAKILINESQDTNNEKRGMWKTKPEMIKQLLSSMLKNGIRRIYKLDNEMIAIEYSFVPTLSIIGESIGWY